MYLKREIILLHSRFEFKKDIGNLSWGRYNYTGFELFDTLK